MNKLEAAYKVAIALIISGTIITAIQLTTAASMLESQTRIDVLDSRMDRLKLDICTSELKSYKSFMLIYGSKR